MAEFPQSWDPQLSSFVFVFLIFLFPYLSNKFSNALWVKLDQNDVKRGIYAEKASTQILIQWSYTLYDFSQDR